MKKPRTLWIVLGIVFILIGIVALLPVLHDQRPILSRAIHGELIAEQQNQERIKFIQPQRVVEVMNLRPGLTVLDLGAGYGLFTFHLAEAVGDGGKVFATDIDPNIINFLSEQALQNDIANVFPVLVQENGLDSFYKEHTFDVIFMSEALLPDAEALFSQLAPSLRKEGGRLWIIALRFAPDFDVVEFDDFAVVSQVLRSEEVGEPIVSRLSPEVKKTLAASDGKSVPEALRMHIIEVLNRMLDDPTLWPEFERRFQPVETVLNQREKRLRQYLRDELNKEGVFASGEHNISDTNRPTLRLLNRLIIQDVLKTEVWERAFTLDKSMPWPQRKRIFLGLKQFSAFLKMAEYELVREYNVLTYHDVWELKRSNRRLEE